jgi:hypothetical protein
MEISLNCCVFFRYHQNGVFQGIERHNRLPPLVRTRINQLQIQSGLRNTEQTYELR